MTVLTIEPALRGPAAWLARLPWWAAMAVAGIAGAGAALAFAPFHWVPLLGFGLCVLIWQLDGVFARPGRTFGSVFLRGWSFGSGFFIAGTYWVGSAFAQRPGAEPLALVGILALGCGLAVFWGLALAMARSLWTRDARRIPVFVLAMMAAELIRGHLFGGFPWNLAAYVWPAGGAMSQAASVIGAYGLTAVTLLLLASPAAMGDVGRPFVQRAAPSLAAALLFGLMWGAGAQRLSAAPVEAQIGGPIVRVADPGYTQREKWSTDPNIVLNAYLRLSQAPREARSQVVIWPEGAIPIAPPYFDPILENPDAQARIGAVMGDRVLVIGAHRRDERGMYNSALVLDAVSGVLQVDPQTYDKNRLVPFGEFIPLYDHISWLGITAMQQIGNGFIPGEPPRRVFIPGSEPAVIHICYESLFPGLTPTGEDRPHWIINITNDAWFGRGAGPWQHATTARYRSIEEGLPTARSASGGVSGIFDGYGRAMVSTDLQGGAVEAALPPALSPTPFSQFGGWLLALVLALIAALRFAPPNPARGLRS